MKIFLDSEFTGLHKNTSLLSIALVTESGKEFYAEFNDYDHNQYQELMQGGFQPKLDYYHLSQFEDTDSNTYKLKASKEGITTAIINWLDEFDYIEIWADVLAYDWVLFCDLFGGALKLPTNIFYTPFDLATFFKLKGLITPTTQYERDVNRFIFAGVEESKRHHALEDARVERICFQKLMNQSQDGLIF